MAPTSRRGTKLWWVVIGLVVLLGIVLFLWHRDRQSRDLEIDVGSLARPAASVLAA